MKETTNMSLNGTASSGLSIKPAVMCNAPGCLSGAHSFPIVRFGPRDWPADQQPPYRLEIPLPVCEPHKATFNPQIFITTTAKLQMNDMLIANDQPKVWWQRLEIEWHPVKEALFTELRAAKQSRFIWA